MHIALLTTDPLSDPWLMDTEHSSSTSTRVKMKGRISVRRVEATESTAAVTLHAVTAVTVTLAADAFQLFILHQDHSLELFTELASLCLLPVQECKSARVQECKSARVQENERAYVEGKQRREIPRKRERERKRASLKCCTNHSLALFQPMLLPTLSAYVVARPFFYRFLFLFSLFSFVFNASSLRKNGEGYGWCDGPCFKSRHKGGAHHGAHCQERCTQDLRVVLSAADRS